MTEIHDSKKLRADSKPVSGFISAAAPVVSKLAEYLVLHGFSDASVLASDSEGRRYSISRTGTNIKCDPMTSDRGFVIRVSDGKMTAECSRSILKEKSFPDIAEDLRKLTGIRADVLGEGAFAADGGHTGEKEFYTEYKEDPDELGDGGIIKRLEKIRNAALSYDSRVLDAGVACVYCRRSELFVRADRKGIAERKRQDIMWTTGAMTVMAARGEEIKDCYKGYSVLGGTEVLSEMEKDVESVASAAIALLDSEPIPPGEYECICAPDVTGMIVHEAFGHGVEMDMFVKKRALAEQYVGKYVASELVTMHDGASAADQTATYLFDDEGTDASDTVIIEKGILKRGISDLRSAGRLGTAPTGNGRRESSRRKAYTRMTNTFFEAGSDRPEDMIASVKYGFLLENARSGMEDPKNWGIQCMVNIAREIKDGKLTGKIFSPIVLTGYVPDLLKSISMVSDSIELCGSGFCGKGYKEWVKVSDGGPYIKARIRLG